MKVMFRDMPFYKGPDAKNVEKEMKEPLPDKVQIPFRIERWDEWMPCDCGECNGWKQKQFGSWMFQKVSMADGGHEYICTGRGN